MKQEEQTVNPSDVIGKRDIWIVRGMVFKGGNSLTILRTCGHQQQKVYYMFGNSECAKHWWSWSRSTRYCATRFGLAMPPTQYIDVIPWEKRLHSSRKLRGNSKKWKGTRRRQNWNRELGKYCGISLYREGGEELEGRNTEVWPSWDWDWPVVNPGHRWDLKSFGVDWMTTRCGDPRGERASLIFLIQE